MGLFAGIKIYWYPLLTEKEKEKQEPATCSDKLRKKHFYCPYVGLLTSRNQKEIQISTDLKPIT